MKTANDELLLLQELWHQDIADLKEKKRQKRKTKDAPVCPDCGNPTLEVTTVGIWELSRCSVCDHFDRKQSDG